jgi:hypothetical protein
MGSVRRYIMRNLMCTNVTIVDTKLLIVSIIEAMS